MTANELIKQALAFALSRNVVPSDEYYNNMTALQQKTSVSIKGLAQIEHIKYVIDVLNQNLKQGGNFDEFVKNIKKEQIALPKHRLDNIYRTNIQSAYAHGKYVKQQENKDDRPYLMYDAVNDSRTRPDHKSRHGVIRHIDDPFWEHNTPPLGYRCRCTTRSLTTKQAQKKGITGDDDKRLKLAGDEFGVHPKFYGDKFDELITQKLGELAMQHPKNAKDFVGIKKQLRQVKTKPVADLQQFLKRLERFDDKSNKKTT